jgi:hypothetical protein
VRQRDELLGVAAAHAVTWAVGRLLRRSPRAEAERPPLGAGAGARPPDWCLRTAYFRGGHLKRERTGRRQHWQPNPDPALERDDMGDGARPKPRRRHLRQTRQRHRCIAVNRVGGWPG